MTIKSSGGNPPTNSLSFSEIEAEFGQPDNGRTLGRYRRTDSEFKNKNCGDLQNLPLDTGIPASGEIRFSDFYGKKLNMVVDYYSESDTRQDDGANTMAATWRYNNQSGKVKVVGGYRTRPTGTVSSYSLSRGDLHFVLYLQNLCPQNFPPFLLPFRSLSIKSKTMVEQMKHVGSPSHNHTE